MGVALGEYELLKRLGAGGMGEVFLARPTKRESRDDDRFIVIKTLLPHLSDDEQTLTMFLDEARLAARLNHGNVAQIYELGEAGGTWFIAMEYVSGRDCAKLLRNAAQRGERFSPAIACRIVSDAAAGLHYSHDLTDGDGNHLGLVHRDVSPANIVVTYEGGVKLIDFGVAKAAGRVHQTQAGQLKGKISYMSPEQAQGKALDKRSDIFSLGIVLHELLTGRKLFDADGQMEVLWAVCEAKVDPPSHVDPELPQELDAVVMKALTLSADDRYSSAQEFRNALESWIVTSGRSADPDDVGALVTLLSTEDDRMERESGPLWDADISVSEITSIVDPEEIGDDGPTLGLRPLAVPPPGSDREQPGGSTALYSNTGFAPPPPMPEDPDAEALVNADSTLDAATAGMAAYEQAAAPPPPPRPPRSSRGPARPGDDEDAVNTSITQNPLGEGPPPPTSTPPPPPAAAYQSGVIGDDDPADELPETALNTPTSIITGDSDDEDQTEGGRAGAAAGAEDNAGPTHGPRGLPPTRPSLPLADTHHGVEPPRSARRGPGPVAMVLGALAVVVIAAAAGWSVLSSGDEAPTQTPVTDSEEAPLPDAPEPRVALTVVTDPPGVSVLLDGRPIGRTPILSLPMPPRPEAILELTRSGLAPRTETLDLTRDVEVTYKLRASSVIVSVTSRPGGATVTEGGQELGVTPFEWHGPAGEAVALKFAKKGYRSVEQTVTVEEGAEVAAVLKRQRAHKRRGGGDRFRPSSSVDPDDPPQPGPKIPTFGD